MHVAEAAEAVAFGSRRRTVLQPAVSGRSGSAVGRNGSFNRSFMGRWVVWGAKRRKETQSGLVILGAKLFKKIVGLCWTPFFPILYNGLISEYEDMNPKHFADYFCFCKFCTCNAGRIMK